MKKLLALTLAVVLALGLMPLAAAESVTPTPPEWCPEDEYAVFPGSAAYEPENWDVITQTRQEVAQGPVNLGALPLRWKFHGLPNKRVVDGREVYDFGVLLEQALVEVRLLYTHDQYNGPYWTSLSTVLKDGGDEKLAGLTDQQRYAVLLWTARGILRYEDVGEELNKFLPYLMEYPQFTLETLTDSPIFTDREKERFNKRLAQSWDDHNSHIEIWLDGKQLTLDVAPEVRNERTMVPIRAVAEAIGADVAWDQEAQRVTMTRAGSTVTMTLDSATATVDGAAVEMDVAPYATNGRTLIPARYVAEFFGQKVDWDAEKRRVLITEDKSAAQGSNLEQWAISMGLIRGYIDFGTNYGNSFGRPVVFGEYRRNAAEVKIVREKLFSGWGVVSREGLISLIQRMTPHGHNDDFLSAAADANSMTDAQLNALLAISSDVDRYMWPYTKEISARWGSKGILAWDLSRMSNLAQWGYIGGYLTYGEALELIEPAARLAQANFSNWDEFYLNYLDGYNWWARNDVYTAQAEYKAQVNEIYENDPYGREPPDSFEYWAGFPRSEYYRCVRNKGDDSLFEAGVIPLPDGTDGV